MIRSSWVREWCHVAQATVKIWKITKDARCPGTKTTTLAETKRKREGGGGSRLIRNKKTAMMHTDLDMGMISLSVSVCGEEYGLVLSFLELTNQLPTVHYISADRHNQKSVLALKQCSTQ